jgi:hypothetical protein
MASAVRAPDIRGFGDLCAASKSRQTEAARSHQPPSAEHTVSAVSDGGQIPADGHSRAPPPHVRGHAAPEKLRRDVGDLRKRVGAVRRAIAL